MGHHTKEECQLLESDKEFYSKNIQQITEILMHFRMWLLKVKNSNQWEQINEMEDHSIKRRNTEIWQEREESVVDVCIFFFNLQIFFYYFIFIFLNFVGFSRDEINFCE